MALKKVLVREAEYFDGNRKHDIGTILEVPEDFGMMHKHVNGEPQFDKTGKPIMVEDPNFPRVVVGRPLPIPAATDVPFGNEAAGLDPALRGVPPRVVSPSELAAGEGQAAEVRPEAPSPSAAAAAVAGR